MTGRAVSVLMPAFNAEATIERAIASALAQTTSPIEIIVVDDGSHDATAAIVEQLSAAHPAIHLVKQSNAGQMVARNRAAALASGGLFAPLDADDLWHPRYLESCLAGLSAAPEAGFAFALSRVIGVDDEILHDASDFRIEGRVALRHLFVNFVGNGSAAVFRREAFEAAGGYPEAAKAWGGAEDYFLQLRIAFERPVVRIGAYLVGYRRSAGSYSARSPLDAHRARLAAFDAIVAERSLHEADIRRWVDADGRRVAAALSAMRGGWAEALRLGVGAAADDPLATLVDVSTRAVHAIGRLGGSRAAERPRFLEADPYAQASQRVDPLTRYRLARLARREASTKP